MQIGFKSASDYSTFTWVKDDEVAANGEAVTVWRQSSGKTFEYCSVINEQLQKQVSNTLVTTIS